MRRENGSGSVYRLSGNRRRPWVARINGKTIGYYAAKQEALDALNKIAGHPISDKYNATLEDIYLAWYDEHSRGKAHTTLKTYRIAYTAMAPLHNRKFKDLRTNDFQIVIDTYPTQTAGTLNCIKSVISMLYDYAIREEIVDRNNAKYIVIPSDEKKEKDIFSPDEITLIKNEADNGNDIAAAVMVLLYTGMRRGELLQLPVADCFPAYVIGGEKTAAGKDRIIPIAPPGRPYYNRLLDDAHEKDRALLAPWSTYVFYMRYCGLLDMLGISYKPPHTTRHTFTTMALSAGVPEHKLQRILGHANFSTTANIYNHPLAEDLISAVDSMT